MGTFQDVRYGLRMLAKNPAFTAVAVLTLALGIGANTAIFSVVNGVLIRPLPYPEPDRLVGVWNRYPKMGLERAALSGPDFVDRRDQSRVFEKLGVYSDANLNLTGVGDPERIQGIRVSADLFPVLGVPAALGRTFSAQEDTPGSEAVVVLSDGLWKRRFGSDPAIVGKSITLNGKGHTVIGVMPARFGFPSPAIEMWVPLALSREAVDPSQRGNEYLNAGVARLKPGVSLVSAQADMDRITGDILASMPQAARDYFGGAGWGSIVRPLKESVVGDAGRALWVLLGAVACLLLIACANVSNLQLARSAARQREIAVRVALGAGRWRISRQLLTESVLLAGLGGGIGLAMAAWGVDLLIAARPANLPRLEEIAVDGRVLIFTMAISMLTGLIFGMAPALQASRAGLGESLKESGRSTTGGLLRRRIRQVLVVSQVSLALILLVGAGLLVQSLQKLQRVDPGFNSRNVLSMFVSLPASRYEKRERILAFYRDLLDRLGRLPGVEGAAAASLIPFAEGNWTASFFAEDQPPSPGTTLPVAAMRVVTPGYFRFLGIPLHRGRDFAPTDDAGSPGVAIVDAGTARRLWPGEDPVGKRITFSDSPKDARWLTVVGVAGEVKDASLDSDPMIHVYLPENQSVQRAMFLLVRGRGLTPATSLLPAIRREIAHMDADQPIFAVRTLESYVSDALAQPRFRSSLIGLFALLALVLATLGIYAVISTSVTQRTQEIGIRMTLGAQASDVVRLILAQGLPLALTGVGVGLVVASVLTRVLSGLLFGVGARDPETFAAVSILLILVSLCACYLPARRAARLDPVAALHYE